MQINYPKHIYEPIRREIAVSYIRHELKKYLPGLRDDAAWQKIDTDIANWFEEAPFLYPVRDFWNAFYGITMGFKLLIHLSDFITAENVVWKKEQLNLSELVFAGFNPSELGVPLQTMNAAEAITFYSQENNQEKRVDDLAKIQANFAKTTNRSDDPVIVTQKKRDNKDRLVIYKGNARVYLAILQGRQSIDAYVGRFSDERRDLVNFWVPTQELLELVHIARRAWIDKDETTYNATIVVLGKLLSFSESAKFEMKDRVVHGQEEFTSKVFSDLGL